MMDLVYVDEQEGSTPRGRYTAVVAAIISSDNLHPFRLEYFSSAATLLNLGQTKDGVKHLDNIPLLHGSSLLRDRSDGEKIGMVSLLLDCFTNHGGTFARLGYYDDSFIQPMGESRSSRIQEAITSMAISFSKRPNPFCFIHEMDREEFRHGYRFLSEQLSMYYQLGPQNVSFDAHNYVGSFIAPKHDLGCQVADISGYVAKKATDYGSAFSKALAQVFHKHINSFVLNELIWWNDPDRQRA